MNKKIIFIIVFIIVIIAIITGVITFKKPVKNKEVSNNTTNISPVIESKDVKNIKVPKYDEIVP